MVLHTTRREFYFICIVVASILILTWLPRTPQKEPSFVARAEDEALFWNAVETDLRRATEALQELLKLRGQRAKSDLLLRKGARDALKSTKHTLTGRTQNRDQALVASKPHGSSFVRDAQSLGFHEFTSPRTTLYSARKTSPRDNWMSALLSGLGKGSVRSERMSGFVAVSAHASSGTTPRLHKRNKSAILRGSIVNDRIDDVKLPSAFIRPPGRHDAIPMFERTMVDNINKDDVTTTYRTTKVKDIHMTPHQAARTSHKTKTLVAELGNLDAGKFTNVPATKDPNADVDNVPETKVPSDASNDSLETIVPRAATKKSPATGAATNFLINTQGCKIQRFDTLDESIRKYVTRNIRRVECQTRPHLQPLTYMSNHRLYINISVVESHFKDNFGYCMYRPFVRSRNNDFRIELGKFDLLDTGTVITDEFVEVCCYTEIGEEIYCNFHTHILSKTNLATPPPASRPLEDNSDRLNVMLIGVDSMSRLNLIRQAPELHRYVTKDLEAVVLKGFNKVADNTLVNLTPMLAGKYLRELSGFNYSKPFDIHPYIWKNFSEAGYVTLKAEDAANMQIFNYAAAGFRKPPTDHYLRPLMMALHYSGLSKHSANPFCLGPRPQVDIVMEYVRDFITEYQSRKYFGLAFLSSTSHDDINHFGKVKHIYLQFLQDAVRKRLLNNTLLIFFGDHGQRLTKFRSTYIGKYEERLPFMYLIFPQWFRRKYPNHMRNLRTNAYRLTTFFDVFETLKDVLHFTGNEAGPGDVSQRGISLFKEIPPTRTCELASIEPHWCMCQVPKKMSSKQSTVIAAATTAIHTINQWLKPHEDKCATLRLHRIHQAWEYSAEDKVLQFDEIYSEHKVDASITWGKKTVAYSDISLFFQAFPGGAVFEATVRNAHGVTPTKVMGDVSRINLYGNQSHCIQDKRLKKFCYCMDLLR